MFNNCKKIIPASSLFLALAAASSLCAMDLYSEQGNIPSKDLRPVAQPASMETTTINAELPSAKDNALKQKIGEVISNHPMATQFSNVDFSVLSGKVYLRGSVNSEESKTRIAEFINLIGGVVHVQNDLKVQSKNSSHQATPVRVDAKKDNTTNIQNHNDSRPLQGFKVKSAPFLQQSTQVIAATEVTPAAGNPMMSNISPTMTKDNDTMEVQAAQVIFDPSSPSDSVIAEKIQKESRDQWYRDNINALVFTVKNGNVTITGIANSAAVSDQAADKIKKIDGIKGVINNLETDTF